MIIIARIRYALVLLLMICPQPSLPNPTDPFDWELCKEFVCFAPGECGAVTYETGFLGPITNKTVSSGCEIILMKKMYSPYKWLIAVLYNASTSASSEFELKDESNLLLGCKAQEQSVVAIPGTYNSTLVTGQLSSNYLYCEFTISAESKLFESSDTLNLTASGQKSNAWSVQSAILAATGNKNLACDPSEIVVDYKNKSSNLHYDKVDSKPLVLTCKDPSTQTFVYVDDKGVPQENATVQCNKANQMYSVTMEGQDTKEIQRNFTAYCKSSACVRCSNVRKPSNCRNCTTPIFTKPTPSSACAQLQCNRNRFNINGNVVIGQPKCISTKDNKISWQINNVKFTEATCNVDVDCHSLTPLNVSKCATCEKVDTEKDVITCSPSHELRVQADDLKWFAVSKITCDKSTSEWRAYHGSVASKLLSTNIQCFKPESCTAASLSGSATPPSEASPGFMKDPRLYIGAGIAFAICLIMALVAFLIYYCVIRKKTAKDDAETLISKPRVKMGQSSRIKVSQTENQPRSAQPAPDPAPAAPVIAPVVAAPASTLPAAATPAIPPPQTDEIQNTETCISRTTSIAKGTSLDAVLKIRALSESVSETSHGSNGKAKSGVRRKRMTVLKRDSEGRAIRKATPVGQEEEVYDVEATQHSMSEAVAQPDVDTPVMNHIPEVEHIPVPEATQKSISRKDDKKKEKIEKENEDKQEKKKEDNKEKDKESKNDKNPETDKKAKDSKADKKK